MWKIAVFFFFFFDKFFIIFFCELAYPNKLSVSIHKEFTHLHNLLNVSGLEKHYRPWWNLVASPFGLKRDPFVAQISWGAPMFCQLDVILHVIILSNSPVDQYSVLIFLWFLHPILDSIVPFLIPFNLHYGITSWTEETCL